jgi:hypothetical protein
MKINETTIDQIGADITALMQEHQDTMRKAYLRFGDDLTVSLSIKFDTEKERAITKMKFVTDKCEDSCTTNLPDRQPELFQKPAKPASTEDVKQIGNIKLIEGPIVDAEFPEEETAHG